VADFRRDRRKVVTPDGPGNDALVILDVRRGWRFRVLVRCHNSDDDEVTNLACIDTPPPGTDDDAPLIRVSLSWNKFMGIYDDLKREFR